MPNVLLEPCPDCGARFPPSNGPVHRYIGASAGCWALYTTLLAGEVPSDESLARPQVPDGNERYPEVGSAQVPPPSQINGLLVGAYAAQHHGMPSPQAIQSVTVHLLVLHGILTLATDPFHAHWIRRRAVRTQRAFTWLEPPPPGSSLTLRHLFPGGGVARPYAPGDYVGSVYAAWSSRHATTLANWYKRFVLAD